MAKHNRKSALSKKGFTVVEVTLVLAITGLMIAGLIGAVTFNVNQQRYNSSVQGIAEYLRSQFSAVAYPQNTRTDKTPENGTCTIRSNIVTSANAETGRSNCLIYGKLITFGESVTGDWRNNDSYDIRSYDIVGAEEELVLKSNVPDSTYKIDGNFTFEEHISDIKDNYPDIDNYTAISLIAVDAGVIKAKKTGSSCTLETAGNQSLYTPEWQAYLSKVESESAPYNGALVIVRSPLSGAISSFYINKPMPIQKTIAELSCNDSNVYDLTDYIYSGYSDDTAPLELCVDSGDRFAIGNGRRMIRIDAGAHTSSAVQVISQDSGDNKCAS